MPAADEIKGIVRDVLGPFIDGPALKTKGGGRMLPVANALRDIEARIGEAFEDDDIIMITPEEYRP